MLNLRVLSARDCPPPTPQAPKSTARCYSPQLALAFRSPRPLNPYAKTQTFWPSTSNPRGGTHTLWPFASNPCGISHTFMPIPLQYSPRGFPDSHNMASIQAHSARHDSKWPSDSPTWPHIVFRHTNMPSRQLQIWPEDSPRRVTMNFNCE